MIDIMIPSMMLGVAAGWLLGVISADKHWKAQSHQLRRRAYEKGYRTASDGRLRETAEHFAEKEQLNGIIGYYRDKLYSMKVRKELMK